MNKKIKRIREAYDEWAKIYDSNKNPTRDLNYQTFREKNFDLSGKKVLEIGCGTGLNTQFIAQQAKKVMGVDISQKMLQKARQRVKTENVHFLSADITQNWDFTKESFDIIIANLVLEHIEQLSHIFEEANGILNTKGKMYIAELHPYKQLQNSQAKFISQKTGKEVLVDAFIHSVSEYVNEAITAGFRLLKLREYHYEKEDIPRLLTLLLQKESN